MTIASEGAALLPEGPLTALRASSVTSPSFALSFSLFVRPLSHQNKSVEEAAKVAEDGQLPGLQLFGLQQLHDLVLAPSNRTAEGQARLEKLRAEGRMASVAEIWSTVNASTLPALR